MCACDAQIAALSDTMATSNMVSVIPSYNTVLKPAEDSAFYLFTLYMSVG